MIRFANYNDAYKIASIYEDAKELFSELGYFQWKGEYPNINNAMHDINNNQILIIENDNDIISTLTIMYEIDHNYDNIDGKWLNNNRYVSIHRNCTNKKYYHQGYMKRLFIEAEHVIKSKGINNIRIDTHKNNIYMQNLLKSLGYKECGIITLLNRSDLDDNLRIAYQKVLI